MAAFSTPISAWLYQGAPVAGGSLYVYQTGTTTPVTIYTDAGLTTPASNPYTLDSNGSASFYVGTSVALKFVVYTSTGTLVETVDPVYPVAYPGTARKILTGPTTYYVASNGSDSNSGLSSSSPFATRQHAVNVVYNTLDTAGYAVTIGVADGNYTDPVTVSGPLYGGGSLSFVGDTVTPASCSISVTGGNCFLFTNGAIASVSGFQLSTTTTGHAIASDFNSVAYVNGNMNYGAVAGSHLMADHGGEISISSSYTISGGGNTHWTAQRGGAIFVPGVSVAVTTPVTIGGFAASLDMGKIVCPSISFSGGSNVTGSKFTLTALSLLDANGAGGNYLPGTVAGTISTGSQYT